MYCFIFQVLKLSGDKIWSSRLIIDAMVHCLEETLSMLDYAHREKNIRNKPEAMADQIEQMNIALDSHQKVLFVCYYI
ncbi:hypothetical protein P8452_32289 [Trifolium repens]|nr:hypothetical protein P8452_32289 [Trifolium repens]